MRKMQSLRNEDDSIIIGISTTRYSSIRKWCKAFAEENKLSEEVASRIYTFISQQMKMDKLATAITVVTTEMQNKAKDFLKVYYLEKDREIVSELKRKMSWCLMQDGKIASEKVRGEVYVCPCGYKYFERGVVPFKMVADTFKCPVCGEPKKSFKEQIVEVFCLQLAKYAPLRGIGDE